MALKLILVA